MVDLQSRDIPTARHFLKRQYWHRLRFIRSTMHLPSRRHRYSHWRWMLRRKKPCGDKSGGWVDGWVDGGIDGWVDGWKWVVKGRGRDGDWGIKGSFQIWQQFRRFLVRKAESHDGSKEGWSLKNQCRKRRHKQDRELRVGWYGTGHCSSERTDSPAKCNA